MPHFSFSVPLEKPLNPRSTMKALMPVAGVAREDAPFLLQRPAREALESALDDEGADARGILLLLLLEVAPAEHQEVIGDVGQRDPHLLAGQMVPVPLLDRRRLHAAHVAAGGRLGEAVGRDLPALRLRHQVLLLLRLSTPGEQRQAVETGVDGHDHAERGVDVLELLADDAETDVVHSGAAVFGRHRRAEQSEIRHLWKDAAIEPVFAVQIVDPGQDLARAPLAYRLLEQPLFFCQIEIEHEAVPRKV
jgi:hypothetical protein